MLDNLDDSDDRDDSEVSDDSSDIDSGEEFLGFNTVGSLLGWCAISDRGPFSAASSRGSQN